MNEKNSLPALITAPMVPISTDPSPGNPINRLYQTINVSVDLSGGDPKDGDALGREVSVANLILNLSANVKVAVNFDAQPSRMGVEIEDILADRYLASKACLANTPKLVPELLLREVHVAP